MIAAQARGGHQGGIDALDVGFGDIITPAHVSLSYPVLLDTLPEVDILAYSLETVVPEKYQAMIDHATENSRMKDFFDVYRILKAGKTVLHTLQEAISQLLKTEGLQSLQAIACSRNPLRQILSETSCGIVI